MQKKRMISMLMAAVITCCLFLALSSGNTAFAAEKVIKWKIQSMWSTSASSYSDSLEVVVAKIKERTGGRLIFEPFPAGALVPSKEIFTAVKRGMVQGGVTSPAYVRDQIEVAGIAAGLPYAFKDVWEAVYFFKWMGAEKMMQEGAAKHGVYWITDKILPTDLVMTKRVETLKDFKGLKLRSSGVLQKFLSKIATAQYLPGSEVYPALASGVIDGAHWGAAQGAMSMKLYDVCKYHLLPSLTISATDAWVFNQKAIDKLPEDIKTIFYSTMEEHFWIRTNEYIYKEALALEKGVNDYGVTQ